MVAKYSFEEFMDIIRKLRSKDGCPWDREQTHESLKSCLLEECYETIEAIDNKDNDNLCEELGDVMLQVALHSVIAEETQEFTIGDVIDSETSKMIRRHPHVFGDIAVNNTEDVVKNWEVIKKQEKGSTGIADELRSVPKAFPAIIRAEKIQRKAAKAGMYFEDYEQVISRVKEELEELSCAVRKGDKDNSSEKLGDILFSVVNMARILQLNAEYSLTNATNKFINRIIDVFALAESRGQNLYELSTTEQDKLWREVKKQQNK
jgi:tetrapyrrole methylase family protein/MazG family protein